MAKTHHSAAQIKLTENYCADGIIMSMFYLKYKGDEPNQKKERQKSSGT
jgi:hypothetical protein